MTTVGCSGHFCGVFEGNLGTYRMKKVYEKPVLTKRERLNSVTAVFLPSKVIG